MLLRFTSMRLNHVLAGLSCTIFGTSVAMTTHHQEDQPAEKVFKNIVSFKGSKASDVIPAMQFMSASLGVKCDFCHTEDRASDEKRPKGTAREMIAMQRDINEKHFEGRNVITCASCHNGHTHPLAVPPVPGAEVRPRRSADVKAADVLAAYAKAVGGDPGKPISAVSLSGTVTREGAKSELNAVYNGTSYVVTTKGPKGEMKEGFNGQAAFFGTMNVPVQYFGMHIREQAYMVSPDALPALDNPTGGTATIDGKDMLVVTGKLATETTRASYYFDKTTGLLVRASFSYPTVLGSIMQINDYSDYKKVDGVELPMTISCHSDEGDMVRHYTTIHVNPKIDPAIFSMSK